MGLLSIANRFVSMILFGRTSFGGWQRGRGRSFRVAVMALTFSYDGGMDSAAKFVRKFIERRVAVNLNSAPGSVTYHVAVMTPLQMFLELRLGVGIHGVVEVVGQLF